MAWGQTSPHTCNTTDHPFSIEGCINVIDLRATGTGGENRGLFHFVYTLFYQESCRLSSFFFRKICLRLSENTDLLFPGRIIPECRFFGSCLLCPQTGKRRGRKTVCLLSRPSGIFTLYLSSKAAYSFASRLHAYAASRVFYPLDHFNAVSFPRNIKRPAYFFP